MLAHAGAHEGSLLLLFRRGVRCVAAVRCNLAHRVVAERLADEGGARVVDDTKAVHEFVAHDGVASAAVAACERGVEVEQGLHGELHVQRPIGGDAEAVAQRAHRRLGPTAAAHVRGLLREHAADQPWAFGVPPVEGAEHIVDTPRTSTLVIRSASILKVPRQTIMRPAIQFKQLSERRPTWAGRLQVEPEGAR